MAKTSAANKKPKPPDARKIAAESKRSTSHPVRKQMQPGFTEVYWHSMTGCAEAHYKDRGDDFAKRAKEQEALIIADIAKEKLSEQGERSRFRTKRLKEFRAAFDREWTQKQRATLGDLRKSENWLQQVFTIAPKVPWEVASPVTGILPESLSADAQAMRAATLNCGYGMFREKVLANANDDTASFWSDGPFVHHWVKRSDFFLTYIEETTQKLHRFCRWLESSEKVGPSFAFGSIFCFLAATAWLESGGLELTGFFHYGHYCDALVSQQKDYFKHESPVNAEGMAPDFLVLDNKLGVHLFEAKGGGISYRREADQKAMNQLSAAPRYSTFQVWAQNKSLALRTSMAVFTELEPGQPPRIWAYDPPMSAPEEVPEGERSFDLLPAIALNAVTLDAHAIFDALSGSMIEGEDYRWKKHGDYFIGACKNLRHAPTLDAMMLFHGIRRVLPSQPVTEVEREFDALSRQPLWKAKLRASLERTTMSDTGRNSVERAVADSKDPKDFLPQLAIHLKMEELARHNLTSSKAHFDILVRDDQSTRYTKIQGGLVLANKAPNDWQLRA